jgi:pantoate--beta-alanine ligase
MTRDLDFGIVIRGLPTVREDDGLALSSRNSLLSPADRAAATVVPRSLATARDAWLGGETRPEILCATAHDVLATEPAARVEYVEAADPVSLAPTTGPTMVLMAAVWFGDVRLIDNIELVRDAV